MLPDHPLPLFRISVARMRMAVAEMPRIRIAIAGIDCRDTSDRSDTSDTRHTNEWAAPAGRQSR
jgi:hypothetical protein